MPVEDLESLRTELDDIDRSLLEAVRDRLNVCVRIAEVKRDHAVPMLQPHRIAVVQDRVEDLVIAGDA
jgi:4-amino-4-deoxychorismate mutase